MKKKTYSPDLLDQRLEHPIFQGKDNDRTLVEDR